MKGFLALILAFGLGACAGHPPQVALVVAHDHVCQDWCDPIHCSGKWVDPLEHQHGPGCGHEFVQGHWIDR